MRTVRQGQLDLLAVRVAVCIGFMHRRQANICHRNRQHLMQRFAQQLSGRSGQIVLDDLKAKAGLALPDEEFQTLSGLLVNQLGRVPYPGEVIALPGVVFQVLDADHRRIYRLAMKKIPPQSG